MAEDGGTAVFLVEELVHEHVDRRAEGVQREVANVFGKREQSKGSAERQVDERRLQG